MKKLILPLLALSLTGCTVPKYVRTQEVQTDLTLREMRSEIEDFRFQINRYEIELKILQGKVDDQQFSLDQLYDDFAVLNRDTQKAVDSALTHYENRVKHLEEKDEAFRADIHKLKENANDVW